MGKYIFKKQKQKPTGSPKASASSFEHVHTVHVYTVYTPGCMSVRLIPVSWVVLKTTRHTSVM